jgi:hypothetical protein
MPVEVINALAPFELLGGLTELISFGSRYLAQFIGKLRQDLSKRRTKDRS